MLDIQSANKYFNRHKRNQIHVIDNTSLKLDNTGLVALLGPSGCGKTTLLNVIGGLDKLKSGKIYINNKKISSRCSRKVDKIRNQEVGYIFQDYKLINNKTVFDNVAIVLKMIGLKDKKEIKRRVEFVLERVGMLRYKKRPASMLSGGEKQRVAIARAIVKDPSIILADEPTGNLDSRNSLEIMKILQAISKERLVILVTHEENLANFYSNRIIRILDGKVISDKINDEVLELDYRLDSTLYLKDFDSHKSISDSDYNIEVYSNENDKIDIDLVVSNGNIYIRSNNQKRVEIVDETSSIEMVNEHYKKTTKEDLDNFKFDLNSISGKKRYASIYNIFTSLINGFKKIFNYSFLKKMLLVGFFLSGAFILYSISSIYATFQIHDKDFVTVNKNYLLLKAKKINVNDYLEYEKYEDINYMLPGNSKVQINVKYNDYYQSSYIEEYQIVSLSSNNMIDENDIICGKNIEKEDEVILDISVINAMLKSESSILIGIKNKEDYLLRKLQIGDYEEKKTYTIVGIVDKSSPSMYVSDNQMINILYFNKTNGSDIFDYNDFKDKIVLSKGRIPTNDYEVIINYDHKDEYKINKTISTKVNGVKLKVVGYYTSKYNYDYLFVSQNTIKYSVINNSSDITIYSNDPQLTISTFKDKSISIVDTYEYSKNKYIKNNKNSNKTTIITSSVILLISLIEIFLMIRSSFLSRIKEIGILRAIGVKKSDIYKLFTGEIIAITTLGGIPGIMLCCYILSKLINNDIIEIDLFVINTIVVISAIIIMYVFNLIIGLLPVYNTLRKTPARILSRHDLD